MTALELLEDQQAKVEARSAPWMVAEQLKDMLRREPECEEILAKDLEQAGMGIVDAEKKIKAFADGHRTGGFACVTPSEAEKILRDFYGLQESGAAPSNVINLADFWG